MEPRKRVVIVDDSASLRALLRQLLERDGRFVVTGEAGDPYEAREVIRRAPPDVVTLDVEMPRMDGLCFLEKIVTLKPLPVVMLSSTTGRGSAMAIEALAMGAVDAVGKDRLAEPGAVQNLCDRIHDAAQARVVKRITRAPWVDHAQFRWNGRIIMIGSSTGGVEALERVLGGMPSNAPPVVVVQHMPQHFMESLTRRLAGRLTPRVVLARNGLELEQGMIAFAPGGPHHLALRPGRCPQALPCTVLEEGSLVNGHQPSVDHLFYSAQAFAKRVVAVLLTGMGRDGAEGMLALRRAGASSLAQDEHSSTVWGMPRVAWEIGAAEAQVSLDHMAAALLDLCGQTERVAQL
ncbi:chemotaxis-specific protein-glutamate methyltransferase CheB [Vannielia sp.]|uniref:chemotaxis-specific protein-glutamate methyltransferase CheB n=1 Tax=Vannielia sp. TaxID=2813045 RepID=UPI002618CE29|nr:chemotaxis-specific protein-glutamate methyltransferase CheB [Vannielia sp.]MDF1872051.1 chemotaxis-specific protein-glutamate methyltransferase CheB [Vannielia sp.]